MRLVADVQKGIDVMIRLNNQTLGGQLNATLSRSAKVIDITNKIDDEWSKNLTSIKSWRIDCNGMYVKNDTAFSVLQDAFLSNLPIDVEVKLDKVRYLGKALITDFPLNAVYNNSYKYNVRLLGDGELTTDVSTND